MNLGDFFKTPTYKKIRDKNFVYIIEVRIPEYKSFIKIGMARESSRLINYATLYAPVMDYLYIWAIFPKKKRHIHIHEKGRGTKSKSLVNWAESRIHKFLQSEDVPHVGEWYQISPKVAILLAKELHKGGVTDNSGDDRGDGHSLSYYTMSPRGVKVFHGSVDNHNQAEAEPIRKTSRPKKPKKIMDL